MMTLLQRDMLQSTTLCDNRIFIKVFSKVAATRIRSFFYAIVHNTNGRQKFLDQTNNHLNNANIVFHYHFENQQVFEIGKFYMVQGL